MKGSPQDESGERRYWPDDQGYPEDLFGTLIREFRQMDVYGPSEDDVEVRDALVSIPHDSSSSVCIFIRSGEEDDDQISEYILAAAIRYEEDRDQRNRHQNEWAAFVPRRQPQHPNPSRLADGTQEKGFNGV